MIVITLMIEFSTSWCVAVGGAGGRAGKGGGAAEDCFGRGWSGDLDHAGGGLVVVVCGKGKGGRRVVRIVLVCVCV